MIRNLTARKFMAHIRHNLDSAALLNGSPEIVLEEFADFLSRGLAATIVQEMPALDGEEDTLP